MPSQADNSLSRLVSMMTTHTFPARSKPHAHALRFGAVLPALCLFGAPAAHATDGYFLNGVGAAAKGEAGVAIALPQDALSIAANPAAATEVGHRLDVGAELFTSDRSTTIHGNGAGLNGTYSGNGNRGRFPGKCLAKAWEI